MTIAILQMVSPCCGKVKLAIGLVLSLDIKGLYGQQP